jgi:hypothetical protein
MYCILKFRLTTKFLGDQKTKDRIRRFQRTPQNMIAINFQQWRNTIQKACNDLELDISADAFKLPDGIPAPTLKLYVRAYNKMQKESFESIDKHTILNVPIVVDEELSTITKGQLVQIFSHIGRFYGLSPWGCKFNYGRFLIE